MAKIGPRCVARRYAAAAQATYKDGLAVLCSTQKAVLGRTQDPRQRSKPGQGATLQGAASGPKWRHCLPRSTWRITNAPTGTHFG